MEQYLLRLPSTLKQQVKVAAAERGMFMNQFIWEIIADYFSRDKEC